MRMWDIRIYARLCCNLGGEINAENGAVYAGYEDSDLSDGLRDNELHKGIGSAEYYAAGGIAAYPVSGAGV